MKCKIGDLHLKIEIEADKWTAKKLYLTNDPFNNPQLIINNNNFSSSEDDGEISKIKMVNNCIR